MSIEEFASRTKRAGLLYVEVYPVVIDVDRDVKLLLLKRRPDVTMPNTWQPVSGKLLRGESIRDGFVRQVLKKVGQAPTSVHKLDLVNVFYDSFYDTVMLVPVAVCTVAAPTVVVDETVHDDHRWMGVRDARRLLRWPQQRRCVAMIARTIRQEGGLNSLESLMDTA
jgi:ADP-ribose pyrophosphatase YjhB (NUDIX family)